MLYLFDLDGTLISSYMEAAARDYADWHVLPGRTARLTALVRAGHTLGIVTNQGGVGAGFVSEREWRNKMYGVLFELRGCVSPTMIFVCLSAPAVNDPRRKPSGAMIREAMDAIMLTDPAQVLFVGDRPEDAQAAHDAGVPFQWADAFFAAGGIA